MRLRLLQSSRKRNPNVDRRSTCELLLGLHGDKNCCLGGEQVSFMQRIKLWRVATKPCLTYASRIPRVTVLRRHQELLPSQFAMLVLSIPTQLRRRTLAVGAHTNRLATRSFQP